MLIYDDSDLYETVIENQRCPFHEHSPGKMFAGCTCRTSIGSRLRSAAEVSAIRAKRRLEHEEAVLAEADAILRQRGLKGYLTEEEGACPTQ